jgi:hypothetical protein
MNGNFSMNQQTASNDRAVPACLDAEAAARFFGWPAYFMPLLARAGHLKPLGKPAQNARKWYATVELERLSRDPAWLDRAIRIVDRLVREANGKPKGRGLDEPLAV